MKNIRILSIVTIVLVLLAGSAFADSFTLTGTGGASQAGVYVAPYYLSDTSVGNVTTNYAVMCDSFFNSATVPSTWTGTVTNWATLNNAKFGSTTGFNAVQAYTEAAWLFTQFQANGANAGSTNFAVWKIFASAYNPAPSDPTELQEFANGFDSNAQAELASAISWYNSATPDDLTSYQSRLLIFTPADAKNNSDGTQEYIVMSPVPEPSSLLLLGSGLAGALGMLRRKILG